MKINELDVVCLMNPTVLDGGILPIGAQGIVLRVFKGGPAFAMKFTEPFHTVATVRSRDCREDPARYDAKPMGGSRI